MSLDNIIPLYYDGHELDFEKRGGDLNKSVWNFIASGISGVPDMTQTLTVSHTRGKRTRSVIRLDSTMITSNPLIPANNIPAGYSAYVVVDSPPDGYSDPSVVRHQLAQLITAFMTATDENNSSFSDDGWAPLLNAFTGGQS